jgi:hypothetical protein
LQYRKRRIVPLARSGKIDTKRIRVYVTLSLVKFGTGTAQGRTRLVEQPIVAARLRGSSLQIVDKKTKILAN